MKKIYFLSVFIFFIMFPFSKTEAVTNKIIANVDDQIISSFELKNRIKTVIFWAIKN